MKDKTIEKLDQEIAAVQQALLGIGPMRPGTLSRQYHRPSEKEGGYWQLSYTYQRRSHTEHVREEELDGVKEQLKEYIRLKELCGTWVDLALKRSRRARDLSRSNTRESAKPQ